MLLLSFNYIAKLAFIPDEMPISAPKQPEQPTFALIRAAPMCYIFLLEEVSWSLFY